MTTVTQTRTKPVDSVNITNHPEVIAAAKRAAYLKTLEAAGKAAEVERKALEKNVLIPALGGVRKAILRGVVAFKTRRSSNSHIDRKALLAGWPEAYAACLVTTEYEFFEYAVTPAVPE